MALLINYRNERPRHFCEVELRSGERIVVKVDSDGIVIERCGSSDAAHNILFRGDADAVAEICGALVSSTTVSNVNRGRMTPLDIVLAAAVALGSAAKVRKAFREAANIITAHRRTKARLSAM